MPTDIKLDPLTHDIDLTSGGEMFTDNASVVAQRVKIAILLKRGEWFRNTSEGIPYYQEFFKRKNNKQAVDSFMVTYIGQVEDVARVVDYRSTLDVVTRALNITVSVETYNGNIVEIQVGEV